MKWLAVNKNGDEFLFNEKPLRYGFKGIWKSKGEMTYLPKGSIKALIGKELTYNDEPFKIDEFINMSKIEIIKEIKLWKKIK